MSAHPPDGLKPQKPERMDSREHRLHFLLARAVSYPRWLSIGGIDNTAEFRMSREDWETIQKELRSPSGKERP